MIRRCTTLLLAIAWFASPATIGRVSMIRTACAAPAAPTITVTGTMNDPSATVTVNGLAATVSGTTFTAQNVPLALGPNTLTATVRDSAGNTSSASITVSLVVGYTVQGTVNESAATVSVNGVAAALNGTGQFSAVVPLSVGVNTLTASATDAAGNGKTATIDVYLARPPIDHL